jgi:CRISPR/Cas system-associated protein Csx1
MTRYSSFTQLPRLAGILPNNMFSEMSKSSRFINFPISMGMTPINLLADKYRKMGENERPKTCGDINLLKLFFFRFNNIKFQHLLRLKGMFA